MESDHSFSGSYSADDVTFLLRRLALRPTAIEERERRIQSANSHYSEMIGPEDAPTRERLRIFRQCLDTNSRRLACDLLRLVAMLLDSVQTDNLTIVSIARAGTPIGVLLTRLLRSQIGPTRVRHYSISVIRDRGIDLQAINYISNRHGATTIRFVDGWTGKGTIANEIAVWLGKSARYEQIDPGLWVPLDISGSARYAASDQDYLIPSSLLGGTISGLISRSVLPRADIGAQRFHGCVELTHLHRYDLSRWFVKRMEAICSEIQFKRLCIVSKNTGAQFARSHQFISELMREFAINDRNRVKIGLGETVRLLLRRIPERILLRDTVNPDAVIITRLARLRGVLVEHRPHMPYAAAGFIANITS